jgi:hypothetical protein
VFFFVSNYHLRNPSFCYEFFPSWQVSRPLVRECKSASFYGNEAYFIGTIPSQYANEKHWAVRVIETGSDFVLRFKKRFFVKVPKLGYYLSGANSVREKVAWESRLSSNFDQYAIQIQKKPMCFLEGKEGRKLEIALSYIP